jgi:hypothetical protein
MIDIQTEYDDIDAGDAEDVIFQILEAMEFESEMPEAA